MKRTLRRILCRLGYCTSATHQMQRAMENFSEDLRKGIFMLKTPAEWCEDLKAEVLDPDGWRNENRSWSDPIDRATFDRLVRASTINSAGYPTFNGTATFTIGVDPK